MTTLDPELALAFVITSGAGAAMVVQGLRRRALLRRAHRRCPACGRVVQARVCDCGRR
jgi:hypothetical protein